jgi:hypothetical protein
MFSARLSGQVNVLADMMQAARARRHRSSATWRFVDPPAIGRRTGPPRRVGHRSIPPFGSGTPSARLALPPQTSSVREDGARCDQSLKSRFERSISSMTFKGMITWCRQNA